MADEKLIPEDKVAILREDNSGLEVEVGPEQKLDKGSLSTCVCCIGFYDSRRSEEITKQFSRICLGGKLKTPTSPGEDAYSVLLYPLSMRAALPHAVIDFFFSLAKESAEKGKGNY